MKFASPGRTHANQDDFRRRGGRSSTAADCRRIGCQRQTISVPAVPAGITPAAMMPAGTGEPIAALNAISADGTIAVGTDSINTFLNPLCGTDLGEHRTASGWAAQRTPSPACGWLASVVALPHHKAWAVGYKMTKTAAILSLTEFYNGSRWQIEPSPIPAPRTTCAASR